MVKFDCLHYQYSYGVARNFSSSCTICLMRRVLLSYFSPNAPPDTPKSECSRYISASRTALGRLPFSNLPPAFVGGIALMVLAAEGQRPAASRRIALYSSAP